MAQTTAQQHGYVANVTKDGNLEGAVANFAQATAAGRAAVTQLLDTNNFLHGHLEQVTLQNQDLREQLAAMQHQIHQMNLVQPQRPNFQPVPTMPAMPHLQAPRAPASLPYQQQNPAPPVQWQPMQQPAQKRRGGRNRNCRNFQQKQGVPFQATPNAYGQAQQPRQ